LARSISGPIRRLSQAVAEIGKGNYDVGVNFKSSDEIGFLANEFSKMVANVRNTRSELENYSKLLERKVVERTKELESLLTEVKDAQNVAFSILEDTVESKNLLEKTLSELKKTQEQLIQAGKLAGIGQMAAGVAHEINNPLTSILGFAQLLLSNRNLDESIASDLRTIEREAKRCVVIIENLLNFSKPNPRKKVPIDIGNVLDDTIKVLVYTLEREKITVIKKCGHGIPKISGDAYQLQQVFMNIIINAARAMPEGGVLTIDVGRDDTSNIQHPTSYVIISFTDTGIGMSDEVKSHIFEPFFSTSYERGQKGTGLGLPISYTIVKEHGGNIEVESEEGKGSTFRVLLPAGI
jgi:two-component system NtrC family sensor kinase